MQNKAPFLLCLLGSGGAQQSNKATCVSSHMCEFIHVEGVKVGKSWSLVDVMPFLLLRGQSV